MNAADVIGYAYSASHHCTGCAVAQFGTDEYGHVPESARDGEENEIGAVFGDSEWFEPSEPGWQVLRCDDCGATMDTHVDVDATVEAAEELGREHGRDAAGWYFDGNTTEKTYRRVVEAIDEGDPQVLDTFPSCPLSGEFAGDRTPASLLAHYGVDEQHDAADDICTAYESGFSEGAHDEIERVAREHAEPDVWELCESPPAGCEGVADLYHWSTSYDAGRGPFSLFCDLIGWSDDELGEPIYDMSTASLGYLELAKLAAALTEYADRPSDVREFVDEIIAAEGR